MSRLNDRLATLRMLARALSRQPTLLAGRPAYLFVLSHMRGNTSLLSHLLGSHAEISGHSEMGLRYRHAFDLLKLRCKVFLDNPGRPAGRYVLDKVLHNALPIREAVLARPDVRLIFIVREPEATLRSILHMGSRRPAPDWKQEPRRVADYYCGRLAQLGDYFHALDHPAHQPCSFFLRAEDLLAAPDAVLARLTAWLDLDQPLRPEYQVFESTGRPGFGDPLGPIKAGRIVPQRESYPQIELDAALLERAKEAHARFVALGEGHARLAGEHEAGFARARAAPELAARAGS